jgi:hypothetical protein
MLLSLISKLPLRLKPMIFRITGAVPVLSDHVSPLPDPLILAGGDGCGRQTIRHDRLLSLQGVRDRMALLRKE